MLSRYIYAALVNIKDLRATGLCNRYFQNTHAKHAGQARENVSSELVRWFDEFSITGLPDNLPLIHDDLASHQGADGHALYLAAF